MKENQNLEKNLGMPLKKCLFLWCTHLQRWCVQFKRKKIQTKAVQSYFISFFWFCECRLNPILNLETKSKSKEIKKKLIAKLSQKLNENNCDIKNRKRQVFSKIIIIYENIQIFQQLLETGCQKWATE